MGQGTINKRKGEHIMYYLGLKLDEDFEYSLSKLAKEYGRDFQILNVSFLFFHYWID